MQILKLLLQQKRMQSPWQLDYLLLQRQTTRTFQFLHQFQGNLISRYCKLYMVAYVGDANLFFLTQLSIVSVQMNIAHCTFQCLVLFILCIVQLQLSYWEAQDLTFYHHFSSIWIVQLQDICNFRNFLWKVWV